MKALVTGGAGFIGSHLAQRLVDRGIEVIILDNLSLGTRRNLDWSRLRPEVRFLPGDLRDAPTVREALTGCGWVFHLAALPSVPRSIEQPMESHAVNLDGTLQLLQAAREQGVERFIFASSSSIYGDSDAPLKHEGLPASPLSPYALQKYAAEKYVQQFYQYYGLPTISLRYFNVFGPRQSFDSPYSGVIARFCRAFLRDEPPVVFGDGLQSRDFTYIDNVVAANLAVLEAPLHRVAGQTFNVACGESVSLLDLMEALGRLTGTLPKPRFEPARVGDVRHSRADIASAQSAFGYAPKVHWLTGLERTLAWCRDDRFGE